MLQSNEISSAFPFESHFIPIQGSKIHYLDEGSGDPILFLHGVPASNYIWRNIIPFVSHCGRCIAPDLIGFGKSDKPNIHYSVFDHVKYLTKFIKTLKLKNITLVMHGWGSVPGFHYAMKHEKNIKSLVFLESHLRPESSFENAPLPLQHLSMAAKTLDDNFQLVSDHQDLFNKLLHGAVTRSLSEEERQYYHAPFSSIEFYQPLFQYLKELPVGEGVPRVNKLINNYSKKLMQSDVPKLMFYTIPGFNTSVDTILWAKDHIKNLSLVDLGEELHFVQESNPALLGKRLADWCSQF